jgi:hypothetical protein
MRPWHIASAVLAVGIIASAIFYQQHKNPAVPTQSPSEVPGSTAQATPRVAPSGFKEYHSSTYHFSLFYPDYLSVKEYKETGTALTVTFQSNDGSRQGFQVFIVPYGEQTISSARLKQDIPSGIIDQQTQIVIDGKPAIMFFSTNPVMGHTREVWFINHGFLYEVTTYKELDSWLAGIMQSWKFQ